MSLLSKLKFSRGARKNADATSEISLSKPKYDRVDIMIGAFGIGLGLTCATFPWYIFFNQEKFGVREFAFSHKGSGPSYTSPGIAFTPIGKPFTSEELPQRDLDFFPTATVRAEAQKAVAVPVEDQPYPAEKIRYDLVHVANGRALIKDEDGLWVVQPGSQLPDASRVVSIEKRSGQWVLVNSEESVLDLTR